MIQVPNWLMPPTTVERKETRNTITEDVALMRIVVDNFVGSFSKLDFDRQGRPLYSKVKRREALEWIETLAARAPEDSALIIHRPRDHQLFIASARTMQQIASMGEKLKGASQ